MVSKKEETAYGTGLKEGKEKKRKEERERGYLAHYFLSEPWQFWSYT
jgi:hypothetical protein